MQMTFYALFTLNVAVFFAVRTYALYEMKKWVFAVTLLVGLVNTVLFSYAISHATTGLVTAPPSFQTCGFWYKSNFTPTYIALSTGSRASAILADLFVLGATIWKTHTMRGFRAASSMRSALSMYILRNGCLYFVALLILNIVGIVLSPNTFVYTITLSWVSAYVSYLPYLACLKPPPD